MLVPISKILLNDSRTESYNLYDVDSCKVLNCTITDIKKALKAGHDIRGFVGRNLRLNSYFSNIGIVGEKQDESQYYTVVGRKMHSKETKFTVVDCVGKAYEFEKGELIQLIKNGAIVAGIKLDKEVLKVSRLIKTELIK